MIKYSVMSLFSVVLVFPFQVSPLQKGCMVCDVCVIAGNTARIVPECRGHPVNYALAVAISSSETTSRGTKLGEKGGWRTTFTFLPSKQCGCFWSSVQTRGLSCQRCAKWYFVISQGWFWEFSPHIYLRNQWSVVLTAHTFSPEIHSCWNGACHSSSPMEWSAWAVLTISCVTVAVSPILKLAWSKCPWNKPWEYQISFNSHNNERPLGRTLRAVAAELIGLTQRIAILRFLLAEGCVTWFLAYVANRVTLAEDSVVRNVSRAGEILDCCRQREIYSLIVLQIKVTLIAVDAGYCSARIPDSSIKFYIHMLFWNLKI